MVINKEAATNDRSSASRIARLRCCCELFAGTWSSWMRVGCAGRAVFRRPLEGQRSLGAALLGNLGAMRILAGILVALCGVGMLLIAKPLATWDADKVEVWSGLRCLHGVNYNRVSFLLGGLGAVFAGGYLIVTG